MPLIVLLVAAVLLYLYLSRLARGERSAIGLNKEEVVSADDSATGMPTLRSKRYGLVGRPDQIVRVGSVLIPVEQKPKARHVQQSPVLQLAAQCLLVHDVYGVRPPYGLLVLNDGKQERVEFTPALERRLLDTLEQMRGLIAADSKPGARWVVAQCNGYGFSETCWG